MAAKQQTETTGNYPITGGLMNGVQAVFDELCRALGVSGKSPGVTRRNVITVDADLNSLIGKEFEIQGVQFEGVAECSPCYWMDAAIAPGAEKFLHARGGLRARILTDGILRVDK